MAWILTLGMGCQEAPSQPYLLAELQGTRRKRKTTSGVFQLTYAYVYNYTHATAPHTLVQRQAHIYGEGVNIKISPIAQ